MMLFGLSGGEMVSYLEELKRAMKLLEKKGHIFLGQNVRFGGTSMFHTFKEFSDDIKIETPVFEEMQMGMSTGMALEGLKICSVYPRMDFLILAVNQLVNHMDKLSEMSDNQFKLKGLIIRTCVGSTKPLMPGPQHCQNYTKALREMCKHIKVVELTRADQIVGAYEDATISETPTVIVEHSDLYNEELKDELIASRQKEVIR